VIVARESIWTGEIVPNGGLNDAVSPTSDAVSHDQWTEASNVEPMIDGVRRRRGSAASADTAIQAVSVGFRLGGNVREFADTTSEYIAQSFESAEVLYVDTVAVQLTVSSGTPVGEVEIGIFTDNAGAPSTTAVQNGAFADFGTVTAEEIQAASEKQINSVSYSHPQPSWFQFVSTAGKATLAADTTYWLVCRHSDAAATGTSNISIAEKTSSSGSAPDALPSGVGPVIWLDPDDIDDSIGDNNNTSSTPLPEKTGNHPGGWVPTSPSSDGVVLHTIGGALPINGHAWIEQPATAAKSCLSGGGSAIGSYTFSGKVSVLVVYRPRQAGAEASANWMTGRRISGPENGFAVPIRSAVGRAAIFTDSLVTPDESSTTNDTDDTDVKIMIGRKGSNGVWAFYGTTATSVANFGTISNSESMEFDALFRADNGTTAVPGVGIVQLVIWPDTITAADTIAVYDWAQTRYGLDFASQAVGEVAYSTDGTSWTNVEIANLNYRIYSGVGEITAICDYQKSDGTQRHLIVADQNVYKNDGGTLTQVDTQAVQGFNDSTVAAQNGHYPSWSNGGDRLTITDGSVEARKFYVDDDGIERWENEGIAKPVKVITTGLDTGGSPLADNSVYEFDYYLYNARTGARSNSSQLGVTNTDYQETPDGATQHVTITGLPDYAQFSGDGITHIRIVVKEFGSSIFRLVKQIPFGTTSTTIESTDFPATTEDEYNHNPPDVHHVRINAENRNFIAHTRVDDPDSNVGGTLELPWRLHWSAINGITPYLESYPALQYRDFDRSDRISALAFMPPRTLIIGMTRSIAAIDARRPGVSDILQISQTIGVAHHRSIIVIDGVVYWLSGNPRGFYRWEPGMKEPSRMRGADKLLSKMDADSFALASTARLPEDKDRSQWWTLLKSSGATSRDTVFVHDRALNSWTAFEMPESRAGSLIGTVLNSGVTKMYLGGADGIEREMDTGDDDDGVPFTGSVGLKALEFGRQGMTKRVRSIQTIVEGSDDSDLALDLEIDLGARATQTTDMSDQVSPSGSDKIVKSHDIRGRGLIFRPRYYGVKPWRIREVTFDVQPTSKT
jgi:hypothetical protein